jgi:hypothetical protein
MAMALQSEVCLASLSSALEEPQEFDYCEEPPLLLCSSRLGLARHYFPLPASQISLAARWKAELLLFSFSRAPAPPGADHWHHSSRDQLPLP